MFDLKGPSFEERIRDLRNAIKNPNLYDSKTHINKLKRRLEFIELIDTFELNSISKHDLLETLIEEIEFLENFDRRFFKARGIRTHFIERKGNYSINRHLEREEWCIELLKKGEIQEIVYPKELSLELEREVHHYRDHLNTMLLGISQNDHALIINGWNQIVLLRRKYYDYHFIDKYCPIENFERIYFLLKKLKINNHI